MTTETISLLEFFKKVPTEQKAQEYFENLRWNNGKHCPNCGSVSIANIKDCKPMPYRCRDCRRYFSVRTNTILAESKLPLQTWLLAIHIMTTAKKGISSVQLSKHLGCTQKSSWFLAMRIRETWLNKDNQQLAGTVEVDETYVGGLEKNKHFHKKLKKGSGAVGKTLVVGFRQRDGGVIAMVVKQTDTATLTNAIRKNVELGANLYTDRYKAYKGLKQDYNHQQVKHSVGEYVNGMVHTNGIESFWAVLKRGYYGIYHYMSPKHLERYVNEFAGRFNMNKISSMDCIDMVLSDSVNKRLTYRRLINA